MRDLKPIMRPIMSSGVRVLPPGDKQDEDVSFGDAHDKGGDGRDGGGGRNTEQHHPYPHEGEASKQGDSQKLDLATHYQHRQRSHQNRPRHITPPHQLARRETVHQRPNCLGH